LRRIGASRLETWLRTRKVRNPATVAQTAFAAANAQHTTITGQDLAAAMVARLAKGVMALNEEISEIDTLIESRFRQHKHAAVILSLPGFGVLLGAEFLAATGGDMTAFGTPDRLAGAAGLAPVPRDSGRISGNLHRPRRYSRRLMRVFYLSAMVSIRCCPTSRTYYDRKRAEGKRHTQAVLALARRRLNVLWALLRDGTTYQPAPNTAAA
jgi:transposase